MNTQTQDFTDVRGVVAVDEHVPSAGSMIWWRLSGTVSYEEIEKAWVAAGLPLAELLSPCTPATALRRAARELREKRMLVRPLGRGNGFAIVKEQVIDEEAELGHNVLCKVLLDEAGRVKVTAVQADDATLARIRAQVTAAYDRNLETLDTEDFSSWLVRMMPKLDALTLREGGGMYFIPYTAVERMRLVVSVLRQVSSHVINRVPAMRSDDAVEAILDAITQEAQAEAEALEKDLAEMKLGEKGFENRVLHCDAVESKVTRYEALLGTKLDTVRERLETLRAQLTVAVLKTAGKDNTGPSLAGL